MFTYECVLAVAILSGVHDSDAPPPCGSTLAFAGGVGRAALIAAAVDAQVLDPREREHYIMPSTQTEDLALLRNRWHYYSSMPIVEECERFIGGDTINAYLAANRSYRASLHKRMQIDPFHEGEIRATMLETDALYNVWDTLRDAKCAYYYVTVKRQALQDLLEMIGPEAFYSGAMPPHLPRWRIPTAGRQ